MTLDALTMFNSTINFEKKDIYIKPVCDFFNINYENQTRKISTDAILKNQSTKKSNSLLFGDNYQRVLLTKKGFVRWINILNPNIIDEKLREKFLKYQELVFDYFYGEPTENERASFNYTRLHKLERLSKKIDNEIKRVKKELSQYLNKKYLAPTLPFPEESKSLNLKQ